MISKGKAAGLIVLFLAIGLITATGAFTTVTAERTATVSTAGDSNALLALGPYNGPNGDGASPGSGGMSSTTTGDSTGYAGLNNGALQINLAGFSSAAVPGLGNAGGVNYEATTDIKNVFVIQNQGTQAVNVSISDSDDGSDDQYVTFYSENSAPHASGGLETDDDGQSATLSPGDTVVVSIYIDAPSKSDISNETLIEGITINADATGA